jgi:uncharacterized protein YjbI with pentapeptide repeats
VAAIAIIAVGYLPKANSFSGFKGKTLWDWLSLAGIPLSLAGLGFWLQLQQQKQNDLQKQRELEQTEKLAAVEREQTKALATIEQDIAEQSRQEEALQNYYDKVSALLVEKNLLAIADKKDDATPEEKQLLGVSVDVIRARTLTTLRRLDKTRKTSLIQFLLESEVISKLKLSLAKADLIGADLEGTDLANANLEGAKLNGAKLNGANLYGANLNHANLKGAKLRVADLADASLNEANLSGADLKHACLSGAELREANLKGTKLTDLNGADLIYTDLSGVDLSGVSLNQTVLLGADLINAEGLTKEQLEGQNLPYLCNTQLPKDIDIDPNRDCERLMKGSPDPD